MLPNPEYYSGAVAPQGSPPPSYAVHEPPQRTPSAPSTGLDAVSPSPVPPKKAMIQSSVESVHLSREEPAEVTRVFKTRLMKGRNRVALRSLPSSAGLVPGGVSVRVPNRVDGAKILDGTEGGDLVTVLEKTLFDEKLEDNPPTGYEQSAGVWTSAKLRALNEEWASAQRDLRRNQGLENALNTSLRDQSYRVLDSERLRPRRYSHSTTRSNEDAEGGVGIPDLLSFDDVQQPAQPEENQMEAMPRALREYDASMKLVHQRTAVIRAEMARISSEQEKEKREVNKVVERKRKFSKSVRATLLSKVDSMEVEVVVRYSVRSACWAPRYEVDVRTNPETGKAKVKLDYIADICQDTGEEWTNTKLTLHTTFSTSDSTLPIFRSIDLYAADTATGGQSQLQTPGAAVPGATSAFPGDTASYSSTSPYNPYPPMPMPVSFVCRNPHCFCGLKEATAYRAGCIVVPPNCSSDPDSSTKFNAESEKGAGGSGSGGDARRSAVQGGEVSATLVYPHQVTLPPASGNAPHSITIASIELEAEVMCAATPALDIRTFLHATMKNTSHYTLAPAQALVRMNGSIPSKSFLPFTKPGDSVTFLLGEFPSVMVMYQPRHSQGSVSGMFKKTRKSTFTQRISIRNTSSFPIHKLRIIDGIATTFDPKIKTSLISPPLDNTALRRLSKSAFGTRRTRKMTDEVSNSVQVDDGIVARWIGDGFDGIERAGDGSAGLVEWLVTNLEPKASKDVILEWEITSPVGVAVYSRLV